MTGHVLAHDAVQARVCQRMQVVCQCRRIRASPGPYGLREKRLFMQVCGRIRTRSDASRLTENHGVPGSNPGPATQESPANSEKMRASAALPKPSKRACQQPDRKRTSTNASAAELCMPLAARVWMVSITPNVDAVGESVGAAAYSLDGSEKRSEQGRGIRGHFHAPYGQE